jgi:hypothetical protein
MSDVTDPGIQEWLSWWLWLRASGEEIGILAGLQAGFPLLPHVTVGQGLGCSGVLSM